MDPHARQLRQLNAAQEHYDSLEDSDDAERDADYEPDCQSILEARAEGQTWWDT